MTAQHSAASSRRPFRPALPFSSRTAGAALSNVRAPAAVRAWKAVPTRRWLGKLECGKELGCVVDFDGNALQTLSAPGPARVAQAAPAGPGAVHVNARRPSWTGGGRMALRRQRLARTQPVELRVFQPLGTQVLSRTWSHAIPPQ